MTEGHTIINYTAKHIDDMQVINKIQRAIREKYLSSEIARDSMWSVCGNVISLTILLFCGVIIARVVGKEVYGQYGTVKSLMTSFASFAAFGLGYSSTKLISNRISGAKGLYKKMLRIVILVSLIIGIILSFISKPLSILMDKPELHTYFLYIGVLFFLKALWTVLSGTLAGYKMFKQISISNIVSSFIMMILVYPLTFFWGFEGAVLSLALYQGINVVICYYYVYVKEKSIQEIDAHNYWSIFKFTLPIAIHEMSYTISSIVYVLIMLNFSSYGEYGIYSIVTQWTAIIAIIPTLLMNVTLSYLSSKRDRDGHRSLVNKMLLLNFVCTLCPLLIICLSAEFVAGLYGSSFSDLPLVLRIGVFSSIFSCLVLVYQSNLISEGRNWNLAIYKLIRDSFSIIALLFILSNFSQRTALLAVVADTITCAIYLCVLFIDYKINTNHYLANR